jgi:hypothetical protein
MMGAICAPEPFGPVFTRKTEKLPGASAFEESNGFGAESAVSSVAWAARGTRPTKQAMPSDAISG